MLSGEPVVLVPPAPIALTPGRTFATKYAETRQRFPFLPDVVPLVAELNQLVPAGGVPVSVDQPRGGKGGWIRFYARRCCIAVRPSQHGDVFFLEFIEPMNLQNHGRLARSALRIAPRGWIYSPMLNGVPPGCLAPDRQIRDAWQQLRGQPGQPTTERRPSTHDAFCDALETVVEGGRQIDVAKDQARPLMAYYEVKSAAESRRSGAGIYVFLTSLPAQVERGAMVELRQAPDLRGRVQTVDGERLTVRFDMAVDRRRIPAQGELVVSGSDLIPRIQRDAIAKLRAGQTPNPRLLALMADLAFVPYPGPRGETAAAQPVEDLNDGQLEAFRRALSVPDMLLVLGPPGTGKTRTIVEIARAAAARGERVLVASQGNTAVDNVVEKLPAVLTVIRVGNEERIGNAVMHKTLASAAVALQKRVLSKSDAMAQRLAPWSSEPSPATGWLRRLDDALTAAANARSAHAAAVESHQAAVTGVENRFAPLVEQSRLAWDVARKEEATLSAQVQKLTTQLQRDQDRVTGLLGFVYRWRAGRRQKRLAELTPRADQARAVLAQAHQTFTSRTAELRRAVTEDPAVRHAAGQVTAATDILSRAQDGASEPARRYARLLAGVVPVPPVPEGIDELLAFADWCRRLHPMLQNRARLLQDWRQKLTEPSEQLHAELIRYADVIGATCIGVGVQKNLISDLEFDLVIIDEAGQIPLASTLVPLVHARRAVLVGDHRQLPPFVDDEVRQWLQRRDPATSGGDPAQLTDLLTRSAFERLITRAPAAHQVLLDRQRRMPQVLADFVSAQFYEGKLGTDTKPGPPSPVFRSPLALIDTADLPPRERTERRRSRSETWQVAGCDNVAEANLVLDLVQWYARHGREWAVIAPYKAQVALLAQRLRAMLGETAIVDRIGTVDTFQGRECDIVLYSFTRSNDAGRVGFLSELRRLNVAVTRAREQLILIGDFSTLVRAQDPGFRVLASNLLAYVQRHGDVVPSRQLRDRLP
ncbi:hypothetical protein GCM10022251_62750 [Phytohabitans flavus]|uniref:AAA+ ATPase domain-containing protein n=1 Tax=Phytohabitans flavus TaxID=1076124 RepID=A0A6F8Y5D2_9ACTN|nr:AAA domain-containing protein [Phytohabitans flavus]BCB81233.1 hypothetical protein Pflav_076430 [Phytohabitans flavus]